MGKQIEFGAFSNSAGVRVFGHHVLERDGEEVKHYIDGALRATIPPEGLEDYARDYPQIADLFNDAGD